MAKNINDRNRGVLMASQQSGNEVTFTYCAKSDGHERTVVGTVDVVTGNHVTIFDRVRNSYRVFILDRIRGTVMGLS